MPGCPARTLFGLHRAGGGILVLRMASPVRSVMLMSSSGTLTLRCLGSPLCGVHLLLLVPRVRPRLPCLAGLALLGQRPVAWLIVLVLLGSPASAMIEAPSYTFSAFHVGLFPWRRSDPDNTLEDVSGGQQLATVYLSPFTGPCPALHFAPETSVNRWSEDLLAEEPYWGASAYPVWPTVSSGAMIAVPCPGVLDVVCLHVTSHQVHYAICVPRICTLPWLTRVLSTSASLDIISLVIPPGLACLEAGADEALHWRSGDLVVALPPDAFTGLFQIPVFTLQAQVRHCAIWSLDFRVANRADVILWTPGHERPRLTKIPARARWSALASTFEGEFSQRYPGRWVPAPWVADDRPHLVLQPAHLGRANVIVEDGGHTFCADVRAATDAYRLWEDLPALASQPTVLSVPMPTLRAGTHVRTGDIVHVAERSTALRGSTRMSSVLLAVSVVTALGRWPSIALLALCSARLTGVLGVRVAPAQLSHIAFGTWQGHCWDLSLATHTLAPGRCAASYRRGRTSIWFGQQSTRVGPNGCHVLLTEIGLLLSWSARQPRARCCFPRAVPPPKSATLLRPCPHMLVRLRCTRRFVVSLSLGGTLFSPCARGMLWLCAPRLGCPFSGDCPRHPSERGSRCFLGASLPYSGTWHAFRVEAQ